MYSSSPSSVDDRDEASSPSVPSHCVTFISSLGRGEGHRELSFGIGEGHREPSGESSISVSGPGAELLCASSNSVTWIFRPAVIEGLAAKRGEIMECTEAMECTDGVRRASVVVRLGAHIVVSLTSGREAGVNGMA